MADSKVFTILLIYFVVASMSLSAIGATTNTINFGYEEWSGFFNKTTSFTNENLTMTDIQYNEVYGKWNLSTERGLHPIELENVNWIPFTSNEIAKCQFGEARKLNNSYSEELYLKNIGDNSSEYVQILMYNILPESLITLTNDEIYMKLQADTMTINCYHYAFGVCTSNTTLASFPINLTDDGFKIKYTLNYNVNDLSFLNTVVYLNDVEVQDFTIDNGALGYSGLFYFGEDLKKATIITNTLNLDIISNYQEMIKNEAQDLSLTNFLTMLMKIIVWVLPSNICPYEWQIILIKLPEFVMIYIGVAMIRGN